VFVTVHGDPLLMERGFETGALGYVRKAAAGEELMNDRPFGRARRTSHR
jgi:hypothetical protein